MPLPVAVVDLIHSALPALAPQAAAMPTPNDFLFDSDQVTPFGLSGDLGQRRFQTGLNIALGPTGTIPLQAMLGGQISWVGQNVALEPPRTDGTRFITQRPGLLLKVNPRVGFQRALVENPDYPLEYPVPFWVVYEGVEPDTVLTDQSPLERFATIDFFGFDSAALPVGSTDLLDSIATDLLGDPSLKVRLVGHADAEGDPNYNMDLGRQRAEVVRDHVHSQGVSLDRMIVDTAGEEQRKDPNPPDTAAAGINRRVEIHVLAAFTHTAEVGDSIGYAPDGVTISVLDPLSHYLDPLNVVLRLRPDLGDHPLAAYADLLAPALASNWVRCVSSDPANDSPDRPFPYFSFHSSLTEALHAAQDNDVIWLDTPSHTVNLTIDRPLSLIGRPGAGYTKPELAPASDGRPILSATASAGSSEYGLRVLGCTFRDGRADDGGAGMLIAGLRNVHIARCHFQTNFAGSFFNEPMGNGGAIYMDGCHKVLVESCRFRFNSGKRGGGIYAENCRDVVVTGTPSPHLDALLASETEIPSFTLPDSFPGDVAGIPPALIGQGFNILFASNLARKAGGAIALVNCTFRIRHTYFALNSVTSDDSGYGGAVAMQFYLTELVDVENEVSSCVTVKNHADVGGAFATVGKHDEKEAPGREPLAGQPKSLTGGGRCRFARNALHANEAGSIGGGMHLLRGSFTIEANRISKNEAYQNGGGVSCIARCNADFVDNLVLRNKVTRPDPDAPPGGGAGIYATFWTGDDHTSITLTGNRVIGNHSTEDGGGLRATCGARVALGPGNLFKDNIAFHNGGGISIRNSHLSIAHGNFFQGNRTQDGGADHHRGGDGGALHCSAGFPSQGFVGNVKYYSCTNDGTLLNITGTDSDSVIFVGNQAVKQGGALYLNQDIGNLAAIASIGNLRKIYIQHAEFDDNPSFAALPTGAAPSLNGSTITINGVTLWQNLISLGNLGYVLKDLTIKFSQGAGLYLTHSQDVDRSDNVNFVHLPGATDVQDEVIYNP